MFLAETWKNRTFFYLKIFLFLVVKFSIYLNGRVFVMSSFPTDRSKTVPLLQFFFFRESVVSYMALFCLYLFFVSPSFGTSGGLFLWPSTLPGHFQLYWLINSERSMWSDTINFIRIRWKEKGVLTSITAVIIKTFESQTQLTSLVPCDGHQTSPCTPIKYS